MAVAAGERVETRTVADPGEVAGINSREDMANLEQRARRALVEKWMRAGVTFRDPATAYIEEDVTIGSDTEIGPNVQLLGRTTIGRGCQLDGTAFLRDATVGDGVHLRLGCRPHRVRGRRRGDHRALRARSAGQRARSGGPHRQFRRDQEGHARSRHQGEPSDAISATARSARAPTSAPAPSPATTTASPSTAP